MFQSTLLSQSVFYPNVPGEGSEVVCLAPFHADANVWIG